jgi:hypothetical protein
MPEALLAQAQQERRTAVDPLYDEVAEWLSSTKKMETCMREIMQQVAFVDEATSAAAMTGYLQHRIRGALNAAGFESTGRKFSAGDYKGMTKFALCASRGAIAPTVQKEGSVAVEQASVTRFPPLLGGSSGASGAIIPKQLQHI